MLDRWNRHTKRCVPLRRPHAFHSASARAESQNQFKEASSPDDSYQESSAFAKHALNCSGEIAVFVFGKHRMALVDSGAIKSAISLKYFRQLPQSRQQINTSSKVKLCGANDQPLPVMGEVELQLNLSGLVVHFNFMIIPDLVHDLILGQDFLLRSQAVINYASKTVTFFDNFVALGLTFRDQSEGSILRVSANVSIPPRSVLLVPVRIPQRFVNTDAMIQPLQVHPQQRFMVANILVHPTTRSSVVQVLNPTNEEVTISKRSPIALVQPVDSSSLPSDKATPSDSSFDTSSLPDLPTCLATLKELGIHIDESNLTTEQREKLIHLLYKNKSVFAKELSDLPGCNLVTHRIETWGPPVRSRPYRHSPAARQEIARQTKELLEQGIISESFSLWQSPIILVAKKNSQSPRFVVDLRGLNRQTVQIAFPLPTLETVLDTMAEYHPSYFSALDLKSGYWQIFLDPETKDRTTFVTSEGSYCFNRMPFGLCNAAPSFQKLLQTVFRSSLYKHLLVYIDDLLVYSNTFEDHVSHLQEVFDKLQEANLRLHPEKCQFALPKVKFLGHILSSSGVAVDPDKVEKVKVFPRPTNVTQLRQFMGLCNFYRRFVKGYAKLATPLNELLRKDVTFLWTQACEESFQALKSALMLTPTLAFADMQKPFHLSVDASATAIGYILSQTDDQGRDVPLEYGGRALRPAETRFMVTEIEGLALVEGIRHFRPFLINNHFHVYTDHVSLKWLQQIRASTGRLARWSLLLQGFTFTIHYRPGKANTAADALSRMEHPETPPVDPSDEFLNDDFFIAPLAAIDNFAIVETRFQYEQSEAILAPLAQTSENTDSDKAESDLIDCVLFSDSEIKTAQRQCSELLPLINYLESGQLPDNDAAARRINIDSEQYCLLDGVLHHLYQPRAKNINQVRPLIRQLAVPGSLRQTVLQACHDSLAHAGHERSYLTMRLRFYWKSMYTDSLQYIASCEVCQQSKRPSHPIKAPLHPMPIEDAFGRWHMDFAGPLPPTSEGHKYILVLVDSLTKWTEAFSLPNQSAKTVADVLYSQIFTRYGPPVSLITDRGQNFMSTLVSEICKRFGVKRIFTSSYHPQTNSQVERFWPVLWQSLRSYCLNQKDWDQYIPSILYAYRGTPAAGSTQHTPYFLLFGRELSMPLERALVPPATGKMDADTYIRLLLPRLEMAQTVAQQNIKAAQKEYKHYYDRNLRPAVFHPGTYVWLFNPQVPQGQSPKLHREFEGPYYVVLIGPNDTYYLRDVKTNKKYPSPVHVNRLRLHVDNRDMLFSRFQDLVVEPTSASVEPVPLPPVTSPPAPSQSTSVQPALAQQSQPPDGTDSPIPNTSSSQEWHAATKLLACKVRQGKRYYRVQWTDPTSEPTWEEEANVTDALKHDFHITHTLAGAKRKRQRQASNSGAN